MEELKEVIDFTKEAIRKNLAKFQYKDEQVLLEAFEKLDNVSNGLEKLVKPATCVQVIDEMITEYETLQKIEMEEMEDFKDNQLISDYECYAEVLKELKSKLSV